MSARSRAYLGRISPARSDERSSAIAAVTLSATRLSVSTCEPGVQSWWRRLCGEDACGCFSRADLGQISGSISSQEGCFVTLTQRVLADPLAVRLHYGHPDVFDKATVSAMIPPAMIPPAMIPSAIISRRLFSRRCISIRFVSRLTMLSCVPGRSSR